MNRRDPKARTIAVFTHEYPPFVLSGVGNTARFLCKSLVELGHRVKVFTVKFGAFSSLPDFERGKRLEIYRLKIPFYTNNTMGLWCFPFTWRHRGLLKDIDLIHSLDARDASCIYRPSNVPFIVNVNDYWQTEVKWNYFKFKWKMSDKRLRYLYTIQSKFLEYLSIRRADVVIPNTHYTYKRVCKHYNISKNKLRVVYKGIDPGELGESERDLDILFIGGNLEMKGGMQLLGGLIELNDMGIRPKTVIIGRHYSRNYIRRFKARIQEGGISGHVQFIEKVSHDQLIGYYQRSRIFVLPTHYDSMPQVLYEAMAAKMPVIATRVGGIPELVIDGETGFLIDRFDHHGLAEKIRVLLEDGRLRDSMGEKGRERIEKVFNNRRMAGDYVRLYDELLGQGSLASTLNGDSAR